MPKKDVFQEVTNTIIDALESAGDKRLPWRMPWTSGGLIPRNGLSGRPYNGINPFYLQAVASKQGWTSNDWFTYNGAKKAGGNVIKGERSKAFVVYWNISKVKDAKAKDGERTVPFLRHFAVFNKEQCEGLENWDIDAETVPLSEDERLAEVDRFIKATGADISEGGQACYYPSRDKIELPPFENFKSAEGYYSTALHELSHWTGHKSRVDRDLTGRFGNVAYSAEELVAEFSSAYLCNVLKVDGEVQHTEYIQSWIKLLKEDKKAIFKCCTEARKASDYLLDAGGVKVFEDAEAEAVAV